MQADSHCVLDVDHRCLEIYVVVINCYSLGAIQISRDDQTGGGFAKLSYSVTGGEGSTILSHHHAKGG